MSPKEPSRPSTLRVLAILRSGDQSIMGGLAANHCVVVGAPVEQLERTVSIERAAVVVVDSEMPGAFEAVQRLRKLTGPLAMVPVALIGPPELSVLTADFLQRHGPGAFVPRPVHPTELASRLRAMTEPDSPRRPASLSGIMAPVAPSSPSLGANGPARPTSGAPPRRLTPQPFQPGAPASPLTRRLTPPSFQSPMRAPTPPMGVTVSAPQSIQAQQAQQAQPPQQPSRHVVSPFVPGGASESPLAQAASPALRLGAISPAVLNPPSLAAPLGAMLRAALVEEGGAETNFEFPPEANEDLDDLVPPELLEPLDSPFESFAEESADPSSRYLSGATSPGVPARRAATRSATSALTPLPIEGDLRLNGSLGRYGVAWLLAAAARVRATGVIFVQSKGAQWHISMHAGHVLALRGSRPEDMIGPLLARLGYLPVEAARFADAPLDMGVRGAALLAARGYVAPDSVTPVLARAAQELLFDLLCLDSIEWEMRSLENSVGIPMQTRAPDILLVQGARARVEPAVAYGELGGDGSTITLRAEPSAIASLPLTTAERTAALSAREAKVSTIMRQHGEIVLPSMLALWWMQHLRIEGPAHDAANAAQSPGPERTRLRALVEAARRKDYLAVLGVSPHATRASIRMCIEARRAELDAIRARAPMAESLSLVFTALEDVARLLADTASWDRYINALRTQNFREEQ